MKNLIVLIVLFMVMACKHEPQYTFCAFPYQSIQNISRLEYLALGSCSREKKPIPIFEKIAQTQPQLFVFLGDNVYGDTKDMKVLQSRYNQMSCKPEFQTLAATCPLIATWDDHDFGQNDAGLEYPCKAASKEVFLKFWGESENSSRWQHEGIYTSYFVGDTAHLVQIILLDLRTFRTKLKTDKDDNYIPNFDADATILGQVQWNWLKTELQKPAKIRIMGSSSQFASSPVGFEGWGNFPLEKQKMADLIAETKANGVIFLSGDIHYGELSKWETSNTYPLYDLTSSGLNQINDYVADNNTNRVGEALQDYNFGAIRFNWDTLPSPILYFQLYDGNAVKRYEKIVPINELKF